MVVGAAIVVVALISWKFVDAVGRSLPWLVGFAASLAILGVLVYALDSRNRQKLLQQSLFHYHDLVRVAFCKYLESFDEIDGYQLKGILNELDGVYRTSMDKLAQVDLPPSDAGDE